MRFGPKILSLGFVALGALSLLQGFSPVEDDGTIAIRGGPVLYRDAGEFLDHGRPVDAPLVRIESRTSFAIQKRQVIRAEYDACVAQRACRALDDEGAADRPAVGLSHQDAVAYAAWLSARTGRRWRLPTDREWALAAGSRYRDDALSAGGDPDDPARRWLAAYEAEAERAGAPDKAVRPIGGWGANEHGLLDLAGNVWEWTSTCYVRVRLEAGRDAALENCGVRVVEGLHRATMTAFVRDPKGGACSAGVPPANLGLRLVRDEPGLLARLGL
ncbi:SUMF1/EgtB/PvdO family nonheme iron enzyme [Prosthecomicrobium sp. N25]|uniref:SUMF1/EgtB/PvdO family nonheme iron enzyme n=1 Tax=Prosthecomicrobium sp. N25 TaxID=3129254 RepID=UPI0030774ECD